MAKEEEEEQKRGFRVTDRRRFAGVGAQSRPEERDEAEAEEQSSASSRPEQTPPQPQAKGETAESGRIRPEISFSTFIMGLSTQTLMNLGEIPSPIDGQKKQDLDAAKELIDLLGILRDKTAGNLDANEQELLDGMLCDLRMRYVEVARRR